MNKKLTAIIVGAVAILAVVLISIFGTMAENTDRDVNVISVVALPGVTENVETLTDEELGSYKRVTIGNPEQEDYQITWQILPANATNKEVSLAVNPSSNATITRNAEGALVTFVNRQDFNLIITSTDGTLKSATLSFYFPGPTETEVLIDISEDGINFGSGNQLFEVEEGTLVMLAGTTYNFNMPNMEIEIVEEQTNASLTGSTLLTGNMEEFVLKFSQYNEEENTYFFQEVPVRVIPYVQSFAIGSHYYSYMQTMADFDLPTNQQKTDFMNKTKQAYLVGSANPFYFNLNIKNAANANIAQADLDFAFAVKDQANADVELSTIATLTNNTLTFLPAAVGNTYTFSIGLKHNMLGRGTVTFTVKVNQGVNVWTSEQLYTTFKDLAVSEINIHTNLVVTPRENQLITDIFKGQEETRLKNHWELNNGSDELREDSGSLFPRYIPSTYTQSNNLVVNGNYFLINAEQVPVYTTSMGALSWANDIAAVQEGLFAIQDARTIANKLANNYTASVTFNNMNIKANSGKSAIRTLDDEGKPLSLEEENLRVIRQGSGIIGLMTRGAIINVNNTSVRNSIFSFWSGGQLAELNLEYAKTYDIWGGAIYGYGSSEITLTNILFTRLGGAAISYEDSSYSNALSQAYEDLILTMNENVVINNYISGTEGWFVSNGFTAAVPTLKTMVQGTLNAVNQSMVTFDTELQAETFNYILQIKKSIEKTEEQPDVDFQYTIRQMIGTDPVTNERIYRTTERKTGFRTSHPFSTLGGGNYMASIGDYSNFTALPALLSNPTTKLIGHSLAFTSTYLGGDTSFSSLGLSAGLTGDIANRINALVSSPAVQTLPLTLIPLNIALDETLQALVEGLITALGSNGATLASGIESNSTVMIPAAFASNLLLENEPNILEIITELELAGETWQLALFVGYNAIA